MVVNEMRGEKIDIVPFSDDVSDFVAKALSPAKVTQVILSSDGTQADVIVPDHQLSLAIGREGQNARLSARLTGVRVDIRSETQLAEGVPSAAQAEADVDYADGEWVTNRETGEMEWHEADGSVISERDWLNQQAANATAAAGAEAAAETAEDAKPAESAEGAKPADSAAPEGGDSAAETSEESEASAEGADAQAGDSPSTDDQAAAEATDDQAADDTDEATDDVADDDTDEATAEPAADEPAGDETDEATDDDTADQADGTDSGAAVAADDGDDSS
jgi:N utilization substance protein A